MDTKLYFPKKLLYALLGVFALVFVSFSLFVYFRTIGAYGGAFMQKEMDFSVKTKDQEIVFSQNKAKPLKGKEELTLSNNEREEASFIFYQKGEKKGTLTLAGKKEETISFSLEEGLFSVLVIKGKESVFYLTDQESFLLASEKMKNGGDLVFLSPVSLGKANLEGVFRLFGQFSFEEMNIEAKSSGKIVLSPAESFSASVYVSSPESDFYFRNLTLKQPKERWSYCFQTKRVNDTVISLGKFPVVSFEELKRLSDKDLLPRVENGGEILLKEAFSVTEDLSFEKILSLNFEKKIDFSQHCISFSSDLAGTYQVKTAIGVTIYAGDLVFSAPRANLLWEGEFAPDLSIVEKQNNILSYNNIPLTLGGEGSALPELTLLAEENDFLSEDVVFSPKGNQLVSVLPFSISQNDLNKAVFHLSCENGNASLEGNLSDGVIVSVDQNGKERRFSLGIEREQKNIPVVMIETEEGKSVESKTQYINASFLMLGSEDTSSQKESNIRIRGRGNSTWKWDKKPYKIHFDTPTSLFGLPAAEEWALFANYADKSLMRNRLAQEMAGVLSFEYCPRQEYVDLFVNGEYQGVYSLGEHLEAGEGRVEINYDLGNTDCGFFLEAGGTTSGVDVKGLSYFHADLVKFIRIKSPDYTTLTSAQFDYIKNYMLKLNDAIVSGEGYEAYIDLESLVDWMIMIELSCNTDCAWRRSTYFVKNTGEKIKMGPVWDFDLAFGNFSKDNENYDIFVSSEPEDDYVGTTWSTYLLEDPAFQALFKERWLEKKDELLNVAFEMIEEDYLLLSPSAEENFERWDILGKKVAFERHDTALYPTYESQIRYLKDFLTTRADWITTQVENW